MPPMPPGGQPPALGWAALTSWVLRSVETRGPRQRVQRAHAPASPRGNAAVGGSRAEGGAGGRDSVSSSLCRAHTIARALWDGCGGERRECREGVVSVSKRTSPLSLRGLQGGRGGPAGTPGGCSWHHGRGGQGAAQGPDGARVTGQGGPRPSWFDPPSLRFPVSNRGSGEVQETRVQGGGLPAMARHRWTPSRAGVPWVWGSGLIACGGRGTRPH